jgi:hypothetical protein
MNIFVLDKEPKTAAVMHCDKHVVKMIVESGQMLSTAHRILDGKETIRPSKSGKRMVKYWELDNERDENLLYKAVHMKHPCTLWTMESSKNYHWHWQLFNYLCDEYIHRYGKVHKTDELLRGRLLFPPKNIPLGEITEFRQAMFEYCKDPDPIKAYRTYYHEKPFKMVWTNRSKPSWYKSKITTF